MEQDFRYVRNILGDVEYLLDSQGKVVAEYYYDIWGNSMLVRDFTGYGEINPFRYRGYYYDTESRLYYLITRYYDPRLGVFLTRDSAEYLEPEEVGGVDLYAYCYNNPIMYVDPTGHFAISLLVIGFIVGAAIGFGGSAISQGVTNGWNNINWGQAGFDALIGGLTGLIGGSGIGIVGSTIVGGLLGFVGSAGGDLIASGGNFNEINWGKAAIMGVIGSITGLIAGAGAGNVKAMSRAINDGKSWGAKTFINFGVSIADKGASQLARQTAALYFANAVLGYKVKAFTYVFAGLIASNTASAIMNKFWR